MDNETVSVASKYTFEEITGGVKITNHELGNIAKVVCTNGCFFNVNDINNYGLYEYGKILGQLSQHLQYGWEPKRQVSKKFTNRICIPKKLRAWLHEKTAMSLSKRFHPYWVSLVEKTNPLVRAIQKRYYSACGTCHHKLFNSLLYNSKSEYTLKDFATYRAAALTINKAYLENNGKIYFTVSDYFDLDLVRKNDNWMNVYSNDEHPNTSLRKTLMNLPGGVPFWLLGNLKDVSLNKPYLTRLELLALLSLNDFKQENIQIINRSSPEDIARACEFIHKHNNGAHLKPRTRKSSYIFQAIRQMFDCNLPHNGNIVGYARKSIEWHHNQRYTTVTTNCKYKPEELTKLPLIDLPDNKYITFLRNVEEVHKEGALMHHCVAGYAGRAVQGSCHLFHVNYKKAEATVEVSRTGRVLQSRGPFNKVNAASKYGQAKLTEWAKQFPAPTMNKKDFLSKLNIVDGDEVPF